MPQACAEPLTLILHEIQATGPMSFARFMDLALYHPMHGYYQQPPLKQIGCQGDFYTSAAVGGLFGRLLAFQFMEWLDTLETEPAVHSSAPGVLVEAGAHDGSLARDILEWVGVRRPAWLDKPFYWILEPSEIRREAQEATLHRFKGVVHWIRHWDEFPRPGVRGVIFSNELLDAFPVFRIGWNARAARWFEWRVGAVERRLQWVLATIEPGSELDRASTTAAWKTLPPELLSVLPDQFTLEWSPAAEHWWQQAASTLQQGKLLTLDYGLEWEEFLLPHRQRGTLRSYRQHRLTSDPLDLPGEQDLTAHVNFTALRDAGELAGLSTETFTSQAVFLTEIVQRALRRDPNFEPSLVAQRGQFQTLTHPDYLGRRFRVLVQARRGQG